MKSIWKTTTCERCKRDKFPLGRRKDKKMYNLIKSHNFTLRHDMLTVITVISLFVLPYIGMWFNGILEGVSFGDLTSSRYLLYMGAALPEIFVFAIMILVAKAVGGDSSDKTINYEMASGHSRSQVYWSRIITGLLWGVVIVFVACFVPYGVLTLINGWGDNISLEEIAVRFAIMIFPMIRFAGLFMLITSLVGNAGGGMAFSYVIVFIETIFDAVFEELAAFDRTYVFALSNLAKILNYNNSWEFVENGKVITWFDYSTPNELIVKTIVVSMVLATVYVTVGYLVFKKKDKN